MKSDKVTVQKRVEEVLSLRLLGAEFTDIRQHASAAGWNVSDRQLWRYIAAGDELLAKTLERNRDKLLNHHIAQRRALYARAMAVSDYSTAARILKDEGELLDLYPSKKTELTGKQGGPVVLKIREIVAGREPGEALPKIREEVITRDDSKRGTDDPPPSSPTGVPVI